MALIIDSHVHVLPDPRGWGERARPFRKIASEMALPWSRGFHRAQPWMRWLPKPARVPLEWAGTLWAGASLAIQGLFTDLQDQLNSGRIDRALLIAHPPNVPNALVLELASQDPRVIPVISAAGETSPAESFPRYAEQGARGLKIHAAADGMAPDSPHFEAAIEAARGLGWPVLLHTGCIHGPLFKNPEYGNAEAFEPLFDRFPEVNFILSHMNLHQPRIAMDLAERFPNVHLETSWQPMEVISEAVRRVGAERVLFGSDWPIGGQNVQVGLNRIEDCLETGTLRLEDAQLILGGNAARLFGISDEKTA